MKKIIFHVAIIALAYSCGESKKTDEQKTDSIPSDTALVDENLQTGGDSLEDIENITEREVNSYWKNPAKDISAAYIESVDNRVKKSTEMATGDDMQGEMDYINKTEIKKLNTYELIYYCLAYPASFSQSCGWDDFQDSTKTVKILTYFADSYDEASKSITQLEQLEKKRDSVILVLNKFIAKHPGKTDPMYLTILRDLNAIKSIPAVANAGSINCPANFTLLVNLMHRENYKPFLETEMFRKMYGDESYTYGSRVEANEENMNIIKELALKMYEEKK